MSELPEYVEDFDDYMFDVLINHHESDHGAKVRYVFDKLRDWLPEYENDPRDEIHYATVAAATEYVDFFNSRYDRRSKIRRVLAFIRERRGDEE